MAVFSIKFITRPKSLKRINIMELEHNGVVHSSFSYVLSYILWCVLVLLLVPAMASANIITASDDAYIIRSSPDSNIGSSQDSLKTSAATNFGIKTYLKFDLTGLTADVASASLTLEKHSGIPSYGLYNVYGLNDDVSGSGGILGNDWTATELTWNNAPGNETSSDAGVLSGDTELLGEKYQASSSFLLGASLVDFINNDTDKLLTIILTGKPGTDYLLGFDSTRTSNGLPAVLNVTTVPIPAALPLFISALGFLGLARFRKRRA